jgi:hypothetical protein
MPKEKNSQTFRTGSPYGSHNFPTRIFNDYESEEIPMYFSEKDGSFDSTSHITGICQSCGAQVHFLIRAFADKLWQNRKEGLNIILQKVGQYPAYDISPEKEVQKYITEEDLLLYKKALTNLSISYGIGAFAYFRRVIENEIKRIVKDLSLLEFDGVEKLKEAHLLYEQNHQMGPLIEAIKPYLPKSMFINGENPLNTLYQQFSAGIHALPEEECLERAEQINILLPFVIKKVNDEKYQVKEVAEAMKKLKNL